MLSEDLPAVDVDVEGTGRSVKGSGFAEVESDEGLLGGKNATVSASSRFHLPSESFEISGGYEYGGKTEKAGSDACWSGRDDPLVGVSFLLLGGQSLPMIGPFFTSVGIKTTEERCVSGGTACLCRGWTPEGRIPMELSIGPDCRFIRWVFMSVELGEVCLIPRAGIDASFPRCWDDIRASELMGEGIIRETLARDGLPHVPVAGGAVFPQRLYISTSGGFRNTDMSGAALPECDDEGLDRESSQ
jgi:hypothetical protein